MEPFSIFIASDLSMENLASSLADIFQVEISGYIVAPDDIDEELYYYHYLDHRLTLRKNYALDDIISQKLFFSKYNYELEIEFFDNSRPSPEYFEMSQKERYAYQDKNSKEKRNKLERMSRFIFENLKEANQFSMMLTYYVYKNLDEYVVSKPSE